MATLTPRGLKIRLSLPITFTLISKITPSIKPFFILNEVENLETVPDFFAFISILYFSITHPNNVYASYGVIALIYFILYFLKFALFNIKPFRIFMKYYTVMHGRGIYSLICFPITFYSYGLIGITAYFVLISFYTMALNLLFFRSTENSFIYLVNLHGKTNYTLHSIKDLKISVEWIDTLLSLFDEWPGLFARYFNDIKNDCSQNEIDIITKKINNKIIKNTFILDKQNDQSDESIPLKYNEDLKNLGWEVYDQLNEYVKFYDNYLEKTASFKSLFNFNIEYDTLHTELLSIANDFKTVKSKVENYNVINRNILNQNQINYLDCLIDYSNSVNEAIDKFTEISFDCLNVSKEYDKFKNDFTYDKLSQKINDYDIKVEKYVKISENLSILFNSL